VPFSVFPTYPEMHAVQPELNALFSVVSVPEHRIFAAPVDKPVVCSKSSDHNRGNPETKSAAKGMKRQPIRYAEPVRITGAVVKDFDAEFSCSALFLCSPPPIIDVQLRT
jgi:hypothetical protein